MFMTYKGIEITYLTIPYVDKYQERYLVYEDYEVFED